MNLNGLRAIYTFEMARTWRTLFQSVVSPVVTTTLYFVVFGAAIGSRITEINGVTFAAFIIPGLIAIWYQRQGVLETTLSLITAAIIVRMVLVVFIGDVTI